MRPRDLHHYDSPREAVPLSTSVRILGERVVFLLPFILGAVIIHCNPLKSEPSDLSSGRGILQGWTERLPAQGLPLQYLSPSKQSVVIHSATHVKPSWWVCQKGSRPWASPLGSPDGAVRAHPLEGLLYCCGCQQPSHCVIWPEFNWSPPLMSPPGTALSPVQQAGPKAIFELSSRLLTCPKQGRGGLNGASRFCSWSHKVLTTLQLLYRQVLVSMSWFAWNLILASLETFLFKNKWLWRLKLLYSY